MIVGLPDQAHGRMRDALQIPKLGSLVLAHRLDAPLAGLTSVPRADWPYVPLLFWTFRLMVALAFAICALGAASLIARARGRLYDSRALQRAAVALSPAGILAVIAGWFTTEVGRQPYTVYGLLRTAQSASPIAAPAIAASLALFAVVYFVVFGAGVFFLLRLMHHAPQPGEAPPAEGTPLRGAGIVPIAAVHPGRALHPPGR